MHGKLDDRAGNTIYGVTKFMDLSVQEFRAKYLMPPGSLKRDKVCSVEQ